MAGRNRLRPLADSCDIDGDQAEVRSGDGAECACHRAEERGRGDVVAEPRAEDRGAEGCGCPDELDHGQRVTFQPAAVDGEPHGQADRDDCECLIVDGNGRQCRQDDERAEAPAADSEEGGVQRPDRGAPFPSEACLAAQANRHPEQRENRQRCEAEQDAEDDLGDRAVAEAGAEVDLVAGVEGRVDLAAVEVGVEQTGAGCRFVRPRSRRRGRGSASTT